MKFRLASLLFVSALAGFPAFAALTDADLDKIRLIVNESEKRLRQELKTEIAAVKQELKTEIAAVKQELKTEIAAVKQELKTEMVAVEKRMKDHTALEVRAFEKQLNQLFWWVIALIGLIALAIAAPQAFLAWQNRKDRSLEKQIETLTQEIERIKQQQTLHP